MSKMKTGLVLVALLCAACGGSKKQATTTTTTVVRSTTSTVRTRTFDATELKTLVLQEAEAPQGLKYVADGSGPHSADEAFGEKAAKLKELGFVQAFYSNFELPASPSVAPPTGAFYLWTLAVAFPSAAAAADASTYIRDTPSPSLQNYHLTDVSDGLGTHAWSFLADRQSQNTSVPEIGFCFVVSNVVFFVQAEGNKPPGQPGGLARDPIQSIALTLKSSAEAKLSSP